MGISQIFSTHNSFHFAHDDMEIVERWSESAGKILGKESSFLEHEVKKKLSAKNNVHKSSPYFLPNDDLFTILVVSFLLSLSLVYIVSPHPHH